MGSVSLSLRVVNEWYVQASTRNSLKKPLRKTSLRSYLTEFLQSTKANVGAQRTSVERKSFQQRSHVCVCVCDCLDIRYTTREENMKWRSEQEEKKPETECSEASMYEVIEIFLQSPQHWIAMLCC